MITIKDWVQAVENGDALYHVNNGVDWFWARTSHIRYSNTRQDFIVSDGVNIFKLNELYKDDQECAKIHHYGDSTNYQFLPEDENENNN